MKRPIAQREYTDGTETLNVPVIEGWYTAADGRLYAEITTAELERILYRAGYRLVIRDEDLIVNGEIVEDDDA